MAENTVTTPLAPMELDDAFAYMSGRCRPENIDTADAVATTGPGLRRLLLDVAARIVIPVTAVDDCEGEPCVHSFLATAPAWASRRASPGPSSASPRTTATSPTSCASWRQQG
ncbi:hypothetical protein J3S85_25520 [Streptomyces lavenduligriseus]|nr:hypothetical protein J3S85_25520 [Streptomyces lavenduligriseus]